MSTTVTQVAILGFTAYERSTFDAFFRLAARRTPAYALVAEPARADLLIVDADDLHGTAMVRQQGLLGSSVMLGDVEHPGAAQHLHRPVNLMLVVRALDALPRRTRSAPAMAPAEPLPALKVARPQAALTAALPVLDNPFIGAAPRRAEVPPPSPLVAAPTVAPEPVDEGSGPRLDRILVVDDSDIALRFMASNLGRFGFQVQLARSGEEAVERVLRQNFEMVFLDVTMQGMDGFKTCKQIKRAQYPAGRQPPTVVMLTSRGTPVDKMRGTMAGCDAYLTKPLREVELLAVVGEREVKRHAYASTYAASVTLM